MAWTIEFSNTAKDELRKLDRQVARRIANFMHSRIAPLADPRSVGSALSGPFNTYWRYRVGDYRIICDIQDAALVIVVVRLGHRGAVYRRS